MISIIIPTWNHLEDCLKPCIESLLKYTNLKDKELIIVANGCTDGTTEYVNKLSKKHKSIKQLIYPEPLGYPRAINEGLKIAKGDYIVLLNNDCVFLKQDIDDWINLLLEPFNNDESVGITGPMRGYSKPAGRYFMIFFCVMLKRTVIDKVGLLDEEFTPGGGEDTDYCIRLEEAGYKMVQVPDNNDLYYDKEKNIAISSFPIYHQGEATVGELENWEDIFNKNTDKLYNKYNIAYKKLQLMNNYERAVFDDKEPLLPREHIRYEYVRQHNKGKKILEIGCSSGYGFRYLKDIEDLDYIGIDYDENIIEYAKSLYQNDSRAKFIVADINQFDLIYYDTIIAYEILEHLDNGRELAQILKTKCNQLFITVPYKEEPGYWGPHHKLHRLEEKDFPDFSYKYITENGIIIDKPAVNSGPMLMLLHWDRNGYYKKDFDRGIKVLSENTVTATISTKNRYHTTLPLTIQSLLAQNRTPEKIWLFDDSDEIIDLRKDLLYKHLFGIAKQKGVEVYVWFGQKKGQVANHNTALNEARTEYIWRIDDDCNAMPNVLEEYLAIMQDRNVGAVGGRVTFADRPIEKITWYAKNSFKSKIEFEPAEWYDIPDNTPREAEHLYSTFLYRVEAGLKTNGYYKDLSPVGHREETIFTHNIYRQGYKLIINPKCITYHYHYQQGGIRSYQSAELWEHDEKIYQTIISQQWGYNIPDGNIAVLLGGIGDNFAFKMILNEYLMKHKQLVIATAYPDVFYDVEVPIISLYKAMALIGDLNKYNIYRFMSEKNYKKSIVDAYREMYL